MEALAKKKEREDMLAQENATISKPTKVITVKVTQAQIREEQVKREEAARGKAAKPEPETHLTAPLPENINRYLSGTEDEYFNFPSLQAGGGRCRGQERD